MLSPPNNLQQRKVPLMAMSYKQDQVKTRYVTGPHLGNVPKYICYNNTFRNLNPRVLNAASGRCVSLSAEAVVSEKPEYSFISAWLGMKCKDYGDLCPLFLPWLQSAAFALLAFASTTVDSSFMISLKIFTSKGILVHLSGSVEDKCTELSVDM